MKHYIKIKVRDSESKLRVDTYTEKTFPKNRLPNQYWGLEDNFEEDKTYTFTTENDVIALFARLGFERLDGIEILENKLISSDE